MTTFVNVTTFTCEWYKNNNFFNFYKIKITPVSYTMNAFSGVCFSSVLYLLERKEKVYARPGTTGFIRVVLTVLLLICTCFKKYMLMKMYMFVLFKLMMYKYSMLIF